MSATVPHPPIPPDPGRTSLRLGALRLGLVAALLLLAPAAASGAERDPMEAMRLDIMGTVSVHSRDLSAFPHWRDVLDRVEPWLQHMAVCAEKPCADLNLREKVWLTRVQGLSRLPPERLARAVAAFLDDLLSLPPESTTAELAAPWPSMRDVLAGRAPEGLGRALASYYTLRAAGVDPDHVRLIVARDTLTLETTHVVLIETPETRVAMTRYGVHRLGADGDQTFVPVYAFDHAGRWLYFPETVLDDTAPPQADEGGEDPR